MGGREERGEGEEREAGKDAREGMKKEKRGIQVGKDEGERTEGEGREQDK